ncbi:MAG: ABC transporter permease subunit, partial [Clostridia bacterium]|nr:ABC transporter permease subunit [Clostridia bacterium]
MPTTFFGWVGFLAREYGGLFLRGTGVTILIAISGTVLGFLLGLLVAIARTIDVGPRASLWKRIPLKILHGIITVYIEVFRGTPMIVQAMVIFYGAQQALGIAMPRLFAAIFIVSINTGAYMAEIIRGGIISLDKGQSEAAHSIGLTHWQTMVSVVLPQA